MVAFSNRLPLPFQTCAWHDFCSGEFLTLLIQFFRWQPVFASKHANSRFVFCVPYLPNIYYHHKLAWELPKKKIPIPTPHPKPHLHHLLSSSSPHPPTPAPLDSFIVLSSSSFIFFRSRFNFLSLPTSCYLAGWFVIALRPLPFPAAVNKLDDSLASVNEEPPLPPPPPELAMDTAGLDRSDKESLPPAPATGTSCALRQAVPGVRSVFARLGLLCCFCFWKKGVFASLFFFFFFIRRVWSMCARLI